MMVNCIFIKLIRQKCYGLKGTLSKPLLAFGQNSTDVAPVWFSHVNWLVSWGSLSHNSVQGFVKSFSVKMALLSIRQQAITSTNVIYFIAWHRATRPQCVEDRVVLTGYIIFNSLWPGDAIWRHRTRSTLVQIMACCLTAPSHYLNQCWLIISEVPWHSSQGIIRRRCEDTNQ